MTQLIRSHLKDSSLRELARLRPQIQVDPAYQRSGDIWSTSRRQLLLDSVFNDFDVPKLYFRALVPPQEIEGRLIAYTVIDGRQRLEAIWAFMDGGLALEAGVFPGEPLLPIDRPLSFDDLSPVPAVVDRFLKYQLDVVTIETDDDDVIEDMFLRLNEASALNAAEKRNAFGGPIPPLTREISEHSFFRTTLPYENRRYRHYDIVTKFLHFEERGGIADTKKLYLDRFVKSAHSLGPGVIEHWRAGVVRLLDLLSEVFEPNDKLLSQVGMASVYYLTFRRALEDGWADELDRRRLADFEQELRRHRSLAAEDDPRASYDFLEFVRFAQSPNDAVALRFRRDILLEFLGHEVEPAGEDGVAASGP